MHGLQRTGRKPLRIMFRTEYAPSAAQALAPAARRKDTRTAMSGSKKSPQAVRRTASPSWSVPSAARKALKRSRRPGMKRTAGNGIRHSIGGRAHFLGRHRAYARLGRRDGHPRPHLYADGDARPHLPRLRHHANGRDPRSRSRFYGDV